MAIDIPSFARQLTVFAVLLIIGYSLFALLAPEQLVPRYHWAIVPFFYFVVLLSRSAAVWMTGNREKGFDKHFMTTTVFRFLIYVGALLLYTFSYNQEAIPFIITFFIFYFAFTSFEVALMYRDLKGK